ncbi:MAG: hypothetical protein QXU60_06140 [Sulfolobales archaeon]
MDLDLYDVGSRLFGFYLSLIIVTTLMATVLFAAGAPDELFSIPLLAPAKMFVDIVARSNNTNAPTKPSPLAVLLYMIVQLLVSALSGYIGLALSLMLIIRTVIPELDFLSYPLIFITSFFQLAVFYYIAMRIKDMISSW